MKILHIVPSVGLDGYGLAQVALHLAGAQWKAGLQPEIWTLGGAETFQVTASGSPLPPQAVRGFQPGMFGSLGHSPTMLRSAISEGGEFDVVHQHGIWTGLSRVTRLIREQYGTPVVIAPHGSLEPVALQKSKLKKKLALFGYERDNLEGAACLHATAPAEVEDFRHFGLSNPIGLVPNGVSEEWLTSKGEGARFRQRHGIRQDARLLLFMSRIAPKKGLKILLSAWKRVIERFPEWVLVVIGGDEDGHKAEMVSLVAKLDLGSRVLFIDPVQGQDKRDAFASADVFILPSISEGFPMVVLDALGASVPSIVTRASAWGDLLTHACGWWVDATEDGLRLALVDALSRPPAELGVMGERAGALARGRYTWVAQAERLHQIYLWVLGQAQVPDWVRTVERGEA